MNERKWNANQMKKIEQIEIQSENRLGRQVDEIEWNGEMRQNSSRIFPSMVKNTQCRQIFQKIALYSHKK